MVDGYYLLYTSQLDQLLINLKTKYLDIVNVSSLNSRKSQFDWNQLLSAIVKDVLMFKNKRWIRELSWLNLKSGNPIFT